MHAMIRSFISALAGWIAALVALPVAGFAGHMMIRYSPELLRDSLCLATLWILPVWLLLLWPLYVSVPSRSVLWRPYICISCGMLAGRSSLPCLYRFCSSSFHRILILRWTIRRRCDVRRWLLPQST
jgi:hypothetical protein